MDTRMDKRRTHQPVASFLVGWPAGTIVTMRSDDHATGNVPPAPKAGFESEIIRELEILVSQLPPGTAAFQVGRVPQHPEWPEPYFEIIPRNPRAARLSGTAVATDLNLTVGEVEEELIGFARGGTLIKGAGWQDELRWIWEAVLKGGFTQRQAVDSSGRVIGGASTLSVNGKNWVFRGGRSREKLSKKAEYRTVRYEPYMPLARPD